MTELSQFPTRGDFYDEDDDPVSVLIEQMALPGIADAGIDLEPCRKSLDKHIAQARECYMMEYWDWLGRIEVEGSSSRPHRDERLNPGEESSFDYGLWSASPDTWRRHWDEFHAKRRSATGRRAGNPGTFRGLTNNGPPLGRPMLVGIYHRLNRWWQDVLGPPFRPDFEGIVEADTDTDRFPHLNVAARLFYLCAREVDARYTIAHCVRVAGEEGRFQNSPKGDAAIRKSVRERSQRREARRQITAK